MKNSRLSIFLCNCITIIGFIFMLFIVTDLALLDKRISYAMLADCILDNWQILLILFCGVSLLIFIHKKITFKALHTYFDFVIKHEKVFFVLTAFLLFLFQILISWNIYFYTGWDTRRITGTALAIANGQVPNTAFYYSIYPNNIVLTAIFIYIIKAAQLLHFSDPYFALIVAGNILINLSGILLVLSVRKLIRGRKYQYFTLIIYILLIGLSPWLVIPYSDTYGMIFPILALYIYLHIDDRCNNFLSWFLLCMTCLMGYKIKPTIIILLFAIIIIELINLFNKKKQQFNRLFTIILMIFLSTIIITAISNTSKKVISLQLESDRAFSYVHFLMMGLNEENTGAYCKKDVKLSKSIPDKVDREKEEFKVIKKRLQDYGVVGYLKFLTKKTLLIYNDGTFAWGKEGAFYNVLTEEKNKTISPFLRNIYYHEGRFFDFFCLITQTLWLLVLMLNLGNIFSLKKPKHNAEFVIILSIIGITLFLLLFEARARYLYCYSPIFVVGALLGLQHFLSVISLSETKKSHRK